MGIKSLCLNRTYKTYFTLPLIARNTEDGFTFHCEPPTRGEMQAGSSERQLTRVTRDVVTRMSSRGCRQIRNVVRAD